MISLFFLKAGIHENEIPAVSLEPAGTNIQFIPDKISRQAGWDSNVKKPLAKDVILDKAYEVLLARFDKHTYRFSLDVRWMPRSLMQASPEHILSVEMVGEAERYTRFDVVFTERGRRHTSQIQLLIDLEQRMPVASRRIMYGEKLDTKNTEYRWVSIPDDRGQLVAHSELLIGKTVRRTLAAGQPVRYADIASEFLIQAGDEVTLVFEENGIRIELTAQARQDGAEGDLIKLYNEKTRTRYLGSVMGRDVVQWRKTL